MHSVDGNLTDLESRAFLIDEMPNIGEQGDAAHIDRLCQGDAAHIDRLLLTREAYWTAQLCTLNPHSLNKRREFRSKNRVRYNTLITASLLTM